MESIIILGGVFNLAFAVFHIFFWKLFSWGQDLASLTPINRAVMQVLNLSLIWAFLGFAVLSIFYAGALIETSLGRVVSGFIATFWFFRALEQVFFFGLRRWLSVVFFVLFLVGSLLYAYPLLAP
ncbi:MAG: hypothetical protein GXP09_11365 [Gammaproteobacteria bacterium]|nr:hypothetical protein [Gammaproteobacteria bacterium]